MTKLEFIFTKVKHNFSISEFNLKARKMKSLGGITPNEAISFFINFCINDGYTQYDLAKFLEKDSDTIDILMNEIDMNKPKIILKTGLLNNALRIKNLEIAYDKLHSK